MKKTGAYFTLEAGLVLPVVLGVIVLTIYLWFFQYDRCLMEQDAGMLAWRGAVLEAENPAERVRLLEKEAGKVYEGKYVAWEGERAAISMKAGKLQVKMAGKLQFPFQGLQFWAGSNVWETKALYENQVIHPVSVIRNYRKMGGK